MPDDHAGEKNETLDVAGAITVTLSLLLAVYAIVDGNEAGWGSLQTIGLLVVAAALMALFLVIELKVSHPLMPLGLFKLRNLSVANIAGVLWAAAMFAWFFLSALYMQLVLNYTPMEVGLAFLPANLIMGAFSLGLSAKLVTRFGIRAPLAIGLLLAAAGLALFARAPVDGAFWIDVMPGMTLLGLGAGIAFNPILLAAMNDVGPHEFGAGLGRGQHLLHDGRRARPRHPRQPVGGATPPMRWPAGAAMPAALNEGYQLAFLVGAVCAAVAGALAFLLRQPPSQPQPVGTPAPAEAE